MSARRAGALAAIAASAAVASAPAAAPLGWTGTLALELAGTGLGSLAITGTGVATVNGSGGAIHLASLRVAGGITGSATAPVTDPAITSVVSVRATVALGTGSFRPFSPPAPSSQPQLTRRTLPVYGVAKLCLLLPGCGSAIALPLTAHGGQVGLGIGGLITVNGFGPGVRVSALAAPWTVRSAVLPMVTSGGSTVSLVAQGWLHGAGSFTSSTAITGGELSLVTPLRITSDAGQELAMFARWTARFVPEPGPMLLLVSGLVGLAFLARRGADHQPVPRRSPCTRCSTPHRDALSRSPSPSRSPPSDAG